MDGYPGCGFLKKHPYLMPLAWLIRFAYLLRRGNFKQAGNTIRGAFFSRRDLKAYIERVRKIGL